MRTGCKKDEYTPPARRAALTWRICARRASAFLRWPSAASLAELSLRAAESGAFAFSIAGKNNAEVVRKDQI